ncbi:MAG TPA: NHLP family bacteriocin export ABC transporter peptidase/permease/ATPase subunit [Acidimicrobiales bacterium]|nr:NHLP family bacteriocin export ABC transporter peptidase/permease/ATPase subunit [Acidimicrobiales bacterium]
MPGLLRHGSDADELAAGAGPERRVVTGRFDARRRRVPTILQMEAVECGAAALAMILALYGRWVPLEQLREQCNVNRDGVDALNLVRAARRLGLTAKGLRGETDDLGQVRLPAIVLWNFNHFVVVEGAGPKGVWINDPAVGPRRVAWSEFDVAFTGIMLVLEPGETFEPAGRAPSLLASLGARLRGTKSGLWLCLLAGIGLILPGLTVPVVLRVFVDDLVQSGASSTSVGVLAGILLGAAAVSVAFTWIQQVTLVRLAARLSLSMSTRFFSHLFRLPISFFQQRYAGTLVTRTNVNDQVAQLLSSQFSTALLQVLTAAFYAVLMCLYSTSLALVTLGCGLLNLVALRLVARRRTDANRRLVVDSAKLTSTAMGGLQNIESVKAIGEENGLFSRWAGQQAKVANARADLGPPTVVLDAVPGLLVMMNTFVILALGSWRVLDGSLSLGTLAAFQVLAANFSTPISQLVGLGSTVQEMAGKLASVDDVLNHPVDPEVLVHESGREPATLPRGRLRGAVELRELSFGYDRGRPPLIEGLSMSIRPGERVAIVGRSGSGKSTVAKLVCGLYQPWSGQVRLDGTDRRDLPPRLLAASLALVDQDIMLFEGTVRDNVTLWDPTIAQANVARATRDAVIHRDLIARPGGFDRMVEEAGRDWSGGQRQRLEIARALATDPSIVVLDEATSALDPIVEAEIDSHLRARGCTCLIVAHRLSTVRDADQIVVMDNGTAVEQGTHESLIARGGLYTQLVSE